ncbi:MAG: Hsp33 family molecular chaperone HslO [Alphaproteobacteria bacterium]|nr:Hsp33 family molecular chaperone HslO [Alphaproteobacteria bacterium]
MNDKCISFSLDNNAFRGRIVRLDHILSDIFAPRRYPQNVEAAMSETTALGIMLASLMKYDGYFTLQMQGDGPISVLVTDVTSKGVVRTAAKFDEQKMIAAQELRKTEGELEATPHWLGRGSLIFTIDQGKNTDLYQGIVDLKGKNLAECAMRYFKQSEQIDTYLRLFVRPNDKEWQAAGILIQKMPANGGKESESPENAEELWNEAKILTDSLKDEEIFDHNLPLEDILYRLYHEHKVAVVKESEYHFGCRCSREKLFATLSNMKPEDIESLAENGKIVATCNFCGQTYSFDKGELIKH